MTNTISCQRWILRLFRECIIRMLRKKMRMGNCMQIKDGCLICESYIYIYILIMLQQRLPSEIIYEQVLPKGFPTVFKQWNLDPMTSNKQWVNTDIVRFNFMNMGKGVFDPYRSYIEITVSTNETDLPVGLLQIDNSAQSFFQQLVIYSNNRQIQRINDYSVLAAYLNDVGLNQMISQGRFTQGLGYGSFDTMPFAKSSGISSSSTRFSGLTTTGFPTTFPTIGNYWGDTTTNQNNSILTASRTAKGHVTNSNTLLCPSTELNGGNVQPTITPLSASLQTLGYAYNVRSQYQTNYVSQIYPQHTQSIPFYELALDKNVSNQKYPFSLQKYPYITQARSQWSNQLAFNTSTPQPESHTINCANFGFNSLFCPFFTRGAFQPFISPTVPQAALSQGRFTVTKFPNVRKKFKIPLISAVMGVLVDPSQFKLLPLQSINSILMEITLDPYAMFTSGYNDFCQTDSLGIKVQQKRAYIIERIIYKLQTYFFVDSQIEKYLDTALTKQIAVITNFWQMSNQYQIPGGTPPNNTYIVGCNSTHLNQIVALFVSNDYQAYSFARKHYRLSNNVTKFWSKLSVDYWPPQPWKGNGGNPISNQPDYDNSVFVQNIYWSGNFMFSKSSLPRINPFNFAVNERPYHITNMNTFYDPSLLQNPNYVFSSASINADTAMGMPFIHQNRCIGKAAYVLSFTPFVESPHTLTGINVQNLSNFQLIFECSNDNVFPRDQTLYIFAKSSGIVKYTATQIKTYGR